MAPQVVQIMAITHRCVIRWQRVGQEAGPWAATVEIGTLPDGQWYVWVTGRYSDDRARLYLDEPAAREVAQRWMLRIGGEWEQIPCYTHDGWQDGEQAVDQSSGSGSTGSQL